MEKAAITIKKLFPLFLLIILSAAACRKPKPVNEITKIDFGTGSCLSPCQSIAISMDSSLTYKYYGGPSAPLKGCYTGHITQGFWDTLNMRFKQINYKKLDTADNEAIYDGPLTEMFIFHREKMRHIMLSTYHQPDSILRFINWIENSYQHVALTPSKDTLYFGTAVQNPMPLPKPDNIKFPPQVKKRHN